MTHSEIWSRFFLEHANDLIRYFITTKDHFLFLITTLVIVTALVGKKLAGFNKPGFMHSNAVRWIAKYVRLVAVLIQLVFFIYTAAIIALAMLGFFLQNFDISFAIANTFRQTWLICNSKLVYLFSGILTGLLSSLYLNQFLIPILEAGDGFDDVEETVKNLRKFHSYNPSKFFCIDKGCFLGLNQKNQPIIIDWKKLQETHLQILGTTGSGKGVALTNIAVQCVLNNECLVWFDPKFDSNSPKLMRNIASQVQKKLHFLNINEGMPPQLSLIKGCHQHEIEEILIAGLNLRNTGTDGDFYRGQDQDAAILAAEIAFKNKVQSLPELVHKCSTIEEIYSKENFWRQLNKLAKLSTLNTNDGINLEDAIGKGEIIYIVGSCDNERVINLQKMVLVRVMQIIKKRDRTSKTRPVCVVLDEFKHLLSQTALTGLGVVRDFNAHFILAHQSLGDLNECSGLDPKAVYGAVVDNTSIKIVYRINDPEHAELLAKLSGVKRTYSQSVSNDLKNIELRQGWAEDNKYMFPPDFITHLPMPSDHSNQACVGILFGIGNAKLLSIGKLKVSGEAPKPTKAKPLKVPNNNPQELI